MANSSLVLSSVDFDTLKQNFKTFLSTQSVFKDYNFDGSNINVLLDVMAYNSYLNAFYLNMVASEQFLDSAQKYDSVISHAKELNYLPRSTRSSVTDLTVVFETTGLFGKMTIPKGAKFTGTNSNGTFTFTTDELSTYVSSNNTFAISNLMIYEGIYFKDTYIIDYDLENQQFLINNKNVDIDSITLTVVENNGANSSVYNRVETLFGLDSESEVYFLQGAQNQKYEVVFGDGLFGKRPQNGAVLSIDYRISLGTDSDGITSFTFDDDLSLINGGFVGINSITVNYPSNSGANQESIDSIKFSAPRYFATQQRAVSSDDYSSLILNNFGGEISDVIVYGGETVEPKLYGRVIVSIKPTSGTIAPNYIKERIENYLLDYIALPNRIVISDPDYIYCSVKSKVQYDKTITGKTNSEIKSAALTAIINYSTNNLEKFGNDLRYSRLVTDIDNSDQGITSNDTDLRIIKRISPKLNFTTSFELEFNNVIYYDNTIYNSGIEHAALHDSELDMHIDHASIFSTFFTYNAKDGNTYNFCFFEDKDSIVNVYTIVGEEIILVEEVGTVDYLNGKVILNDINIASYDNYVSIYARPRDKDILSSKNKIVLIDSNDVNISVTETRR